MIVRNFDLNLLKVFEAMVEHRSVDGASRALWLTPSAICHALSCLRDALCDPLFVAGEGGLTPTVRAMELAPDLLSGLKRIRLGLGIPPFTPGSIRRSFRIAVSDDTSFLLCPLIRMAIGSYPLTGFELCHLPGVAPLRALHSGRIDVVVGRELSADGIGALRSTRLCDEDEILVARPGHPLCSGPILELQLTSYPRAAMFKDQDGTVERQTLPNARPPSVLVDSFTLLPALLASTDMIGFMPRSTAEVAIRAGCISQLCHELPIRLSSIDMVWHVRSEGDPGMRWLLDELSEIGRIACASNNPAANVATWIETLESANSYLGTVV